MSEQKHTPISCECGWRGEVIDLIGHKWSDDKKCPTCERAFEEWSPRPTPAMGYSAKLCSYSPEAIDAFCGWIRGQHSSFEEVPTTRDEQLFRFKVRSRKRRTGIIAKTNSGKMLFLGAAEFHFQQFVKTWGTVKCDAGQST